MRNGLNNPIYGEPNTVCTETYLMIGKFENEEVCKNVMTYISTKFFRFLVMLIKNTQDAPKRVYQLVPMQDFSRAWTDEQLYTKYGLSKDEINFIEQMIRPMDNGTGEKVKKSRTKKAKQADLLESGDE